TEGEILVDGRPLKNLGIERYRSMLGVVMQDDQLFAGSIADNIGFFSEYLDPVRIEECARQAAIHDDITAMPMDYNTLIGDMGTVLSGGQKQRVLIARALYHRPGVLLLDEATSHLDIEREKVVNAAIRSTLVTRIIVAHRPETIHSTDRIIVLDKGRIVKDLRLVDNPELSSLERLLAS
ncbi:MAG: ATP-binding cassette domain-containing protein, partial [Burkholderiales bacterium]